MTDTAQLLRQYVEHGSEPAFRELVERHLGLVYSAALRMVGGDAHLAQDVAQTVFTHLARKAASLPPDIVLGGWLHRHTCFVAATAIRTERRRQARERQAAEMNAVNDSPEPGWEEVAPILDEAMQGLDLSDRDALVLRYFERRDLRSIGAALGVSEDAAQKRVARALEKLRLFLTKRGVTLSAATLVTLLGGQAVGATPTGLAATVTGAALAGAAVGGGAGMALLKLLGISKLKVAIGSAVMAGLAVPLVLQHHSLKGLQAEVQELRAQGEELSALRAENARLAGLKTDAEELERLRQEHLELLRLRNLVSLQQKRNAEPPPPIAVAVAVPAASTAVLPVPVPVGYNGPRLRYEGQPGSTIQIDGYSTNRAGTVAGQIISGFMEYDASAINDLSKVAKANPKVEVTVPVSSLKPQITGGKAKMQGAIAQALKNDKGQNPNIKYRLLEMTLKEPPKSPTGPAQFDTKGELTVCGVTRTNSMVVTMEMVGPTNKVTGSVAMKMTDYGVKPPVLLGLLSTADDIKVSFEWLTLPVPGAGRLSPGR